jgi:pilus assembly protein TadC
MTNIFVSVVNAIYPDLKRDLFITNMNKQVDEFVKLTVLISIVMTLIFMIPITMLIFLFRAQNPALFISFFFCLILLLTFFIVLKIPHFNKVNLGRRIEAEVAVTGRRLLIQLESGKSLMNSIIDVAKHKKESSKALEHIAYELYMGKPLEQAINEAIETSPSKTFRKIFIQIRNSLKTGADLKNTLKATLEDITREKTIEFESFGKQLNPIGLFYMIFGTIAPSLGVVLLTIVLTILRITIEFKVLAVFLLLIAIIQFVFIMVFAKMRPELEI